MDTPYQPTGSGKWIWRKPLMRDVIEFGTLPDPRDAQIAELEAAWSIAQKAGEGLVAICKDHERRAIVYEARIAELEAALSPEGDMCITHEELPA